MTRHFPDFIDAYVSTFAPRGEAPERFHYWTAVSVLGGSLRRRVYLDMGTFRWYPNFYIILVGPPGTVKKSSVINIGARLLRAVPHVNIGPDVTTWQKFLEEVAAAKDMFAEGDPATGTDEERLAALVDQVHTVTCAVSMQISELGTFLDPNDPAMINMLTELWDCKLDQAFTKMTKTQGSDTLMNPFVNIVAGTTPQWMNDNFRGRFGGWGFSSRCIFLHASKPDRFVAYPGDSWSKGELSDTYARFTEDLVAISELQGVYELEPAAKELGRAWYAHHGDRKVTLDSHPHHDPWLSYYLARKFDHIHKLAMVLAASRRSGLVIRTGDLTDAIRRCDEIEEELSLIFATKESGKAEDKLRMDVWNAIAHAITVAGEAVEESSVYGYTLRWMSYGNAKAMLLHLLESHWLERFQDGGQYWLRFGDKAVIDHSKMPKKEDSE